MLKILSIAIYFFRELIFDYKEEYDFRSSKFNIKKVLAFVVLLGSVSLNAFLSVRIYHLSKANIELRNATTTSGKNTLAAPSDSGKAALPAKGKGAS